MKAFKRCAPTSIPLLAAATRPPSKPEENTLFVIACSARPLISRTEVDYHELHRVVLTKVAADEEMADESCGAPDSHLNTIL
jgi:hypothetical protein